MESNIDETHTLYQLCSTQPLQLSSTQQRIKVLRADDVPKYAREVAQMVYGLNKAWLRTALTKLLIRAGSPMIFLFSMIIPWGLTR